MEITQIKDKVTARAFAISLCSSVIHYKADGSVSDNIERAKQFADFIIGDAELPEVAEDPTNKVLDIWKKVKDTQNETH